MFPFEFKLPEGPASGAMWLILLLMTLVNFAMGVFWLFLGWRAMKAHEKLPEVLGAALRTTSAAAPESTQTTNP